jgi:hypothetical protein
MAQVKFSDLFSRLIDVCSWNISLAMLMSISLILAPAASAKSINPTMHFQQDPQHVEYNGLAHVILKEAYLRIGHPIKQNSALKSDVDGILISPINTQLNADYIRIPIAIVKLKVFAYAHKSQQGVRYEFGLLGNRISIVEGMPLIQNNMMGIVTAKMNSVNSSLKSLLRNQVDIVLLPEFCALGRSKKHLLKQVTVLLPAVYEVLMYHYVSKENQHLVSGLKRSLKSMEKRQMISQVTHSYKAVLKADAEA